MRTGIGCRTPSRSMDCGRAALLVFDDSESAYPAECAAPMPVWYDLDLRMLGKRPTGDLPGGLGGLPCTGVFSRVLDTSDNMRLSSSSLSHTSSRPSVEAARELVNLGMDPLNIPLSDLGSDLDLLSGSPRSMRKGPGDSGLPSAHRSVDLDLLSLNSDLKDRLSEQDLLTGESSRSYFLNRLSFDLDLLESSSLSLNCGMYMSLYDLHLSQRSLEALLVLFRFVTLRLTLKFSSVNSA